MRKTILTVSHGFPFMKSRQEVVNVEELELSPLEVAIEAITQRATSLDNLVKTKPVNIKLLQLQLQVFGALFISFRSIIWFLIISF